MNRELADKVGTIVVPTLFIVRHKAQFQICGFRKLTAMSIIGKS